MDCENLITKGNRGVSSDPVREPDPALDYIDDVCQAWVRGEPAPEPPPDMGKSAYFGTPGGEEGEEDMTEYGSVMDVAEGNVRETDVVESLRREVAELRTIVENLQAAAAKGCSTCKSKGRKPRTNTAATQTDLGEQKGARKKAPQKGPLSEPRPPAETLPPVSARAASGKTPKKGDQKEGSSRAVKPSSDKVKTPRGQGGKAAGAAKVPGTKGGARTERGGKAEIPRLPRTAAIGVLCEGGASYANVVKHLRNSVDIMSKGVAEVSTKLSLNGSLRLEMRLKEAEGAGQQTGNLARLFRETLAEKGLLKGVTVSVPTRKADFRITGIDPATTMDALAPTLASKLEIGEAKIMFGPLRRDARGMGSVWVRVPLEAAQKLRGTRSLPVGWAHCRVTYLEDRPLQCFKCWGFGHLGQRCKGPDRRGLCFRCGESGHKAVDCSAKPRCIPCADAGHTKVAHRMAGPSCTTCKETRHKPIRPFRRSPEEIAAAEAGQVPMEIAGESIKDQEGKPGGGTAAGGVPREATPVASTSGSVPPSVPPTPRRKRKGDAREVEAGPSNAPSTLATSASQGVPPAKRLGTPQVVLRRTKAKAMLGALLGSSSPKPKSSKEPGGETRGGTAR